MVREQAIATTGMWAGFVRTKAGMVSGWHHHGAYETTIYVLSGGLRMEFRPAGDSTVEAGTGDFVYVAPGAIHRESNPSGDESDIVVVRALVKMRGNAHLVGGVGGENRAADGGQRELD
jgi:uncharacterized RmlC-like cupin family protein